MVDAVLLEWEGVLADTGAARRETLLRALADAGVSWTAAAYDDACCESPGLQAAAVAALARSGRDDATLADLVALRAGRAFVERLSHGFSLQPGAAQLITDGQHQARIAVVTCAARAETDLVLRVSGLESAMTCVVTADDGLPPPPSPATFERALVRLGRRRAVPPQFVVALVQTAAAIRAARAAGARVLAVGAPAHVAIDADAAVSDLREMTLDAVADLVGIAPLEPQS